MVYFNPETRSRKLNGELSTKYCGNAKIALSQLHFDPGEEADEKKISHLQRVFQQVGCDRQNPNHFISGTIPENVLQASLQYSHRNADDLRSPEPPELRLPAGQRIQCLDGYHRILALGKFNRNITWWPVRLYIDLSREACQALATQFANEGKCSDGEIVANILRYPEHSVDANQEWAKLDKSKPRILRSILRHPELSPAFKRVIRIPGLRHGLLLATWNKVFYCVEEVIRYLELIYTAWVDIMGSETALDYVDNDGVQELESRVPGVSYYDERHVEFKLRDEAIFRALLDGEQREQILQNLKQVNYLIPSIRTLQEDFKYLRPCTQVMKKLLSDRDLHRLPVTVQAIARNAFSTEGSFDHEVVFLRSLKELYLYVMQDVCQLSGLPPLQDPADNEDYKLLPCDAIAWKRLAKQARRLGFASNEVVRLCHTDPDRETAVKALRDARPLPHFDYGSNFEELVDGLVRAFGTARPVEPPGPQAELTSHVGEPVARRCGRVYSNMYDKDRHCITLENMTCEVPKDKDVTSLFVRRSVFHAFWGWPDDQGEAQTDNQRDDQDSQGTDEDMDDVNLGQFPSRGDGVDLEMRDEEPREKRQSQMAKPNRIERRKRGATVATEVSRTHRLQEKLEKAMKTPDSQPLLTTTQGGSAGRYKLSADHLRIKPFPSMSREIEVCYQSSNDKI
ncbi:hypothetical protein PG987_004235 [Apiospora arundinis]